MLFWPLWFWMLGSTLLPNPVFVKLQCLLLWWFCVTLVLLPLPPLFLRWLLYLDEISSLFVGFSRLGLSFLNFKVIQSLGVLVKSKTRFSRSEIPPFQQTSWWCQCCWAIDHKVLKMMFSKILSFVLFSHSVITARLNFPNYLLVQPSFPYFKKLRPTS